jgi:hypothetical protein
MGAAVNLAGGGLNAAGWDAETGNGPQQQTFSAAMPFSVFFLALLAARTVDGGVWWCGPPCSTWVWVARHVTKRAKGYMIYGDESRADIRLANENMFWFGALLRFLHALGIHVVVEQPVTSLLYDFPPVATFFDTVSYITTSVSLGRWGSNTAKPLRLMGDWPGLRELRRLHVLRPAPTQKLKTTTKLSANGRWWNGIASSLRESKEYPEEFCMCVASILKDQFRRRPPSSTWATAVVPPRLRIRSKTPAAALCALRAPKVHSFPAPTNSIGDIEGDEVSAPSLDIGGIDAGSDASLADSGAQPEADLGDIEGEDPVSADVPSSPGAHGDVFPAFHFADSNVEIVCQPHKVRRVDLD